MYRTITKEERVRVARSGGVGNGSGCNPVVAATSVKGGRCLESRARWTMHMLYCVLDEPARTQLDGKLRRRCRGASDLGITLFREAAVAMVLLAWRVC